MRVEDGGGNSDPYQITTNSVAGGGEENSMNYQQIMQILHGLKGHEVAGAAESFRHLGNTLETVASKLAAEGDKLGGEQWSGTSASKAMAKFQQLHDQAAQLAAQAHSTANVMDWVGNDVMPTFASIPSPHVMGTGEQAAAGAAAGSVLMPGVGSVIGGGAAAMFGGNGQAKADQAARQYMAALNNHLATANNALPPSTAGPSQRQGAGYAWTTPNHGNSGIGTGTSPNSGYNGPGGSNGPGTGVGSPYAPPATGHANLAKLSTGNGGSGSLQSSAPAPAAPTTPPFTPGSPAAGGGGANPFTSMPVMGGGAGAGANDGMPGEGGLPGEGGAAGDRALGEDALKLGKNGLPGEGSTLGDGAAGDSALGAEGSMGAAGDAAGSASAAGSEGAAAGAAGAEAAGAEAAGAAGGEAGGMMPMGGMGGGGSQDKERQRQAWMEEDESIWGVPDENIGPVIG